MRNFSQTIPDGAVDAEAAHMPPRHSGDPSSLAGAGATPPPCTRRNSHMRWREGRPDVAGECDVCAEIVTQDDDESKDEGMVNTSRDLLDSFEGQADDDDVDS